MSLGIDFGTIYNKIGCFDNTGFRVITNIYQKSVTPSVAFMKNKDNWLFGERAIKFSLNKPKQYIYGLKLMLGHKFNDGFIQKKLNSWKFKIANDQNNIKIIIESNNENHEFFPYEITGFILKNLIDSTKSNLPSEISYTIISIPANFSKYQKEDLKKATELVGIQNVHFVIEPILVSIAYFYNMRTDPSKDRIILIYSLGYSKLEVSIIKIYKNSYKIFTNSDEKINGHQIDNNIYNYIYEKMLEKYETRRDFITNPKTQSKLRISCQESKSILSISDSVDIKIKDDENEFKNENEEEEEENLYITLAIEEFNEINHKLFENSMDPVLAVMEKADIESKDISDVFLAGGLTFIKKIREKLNEITNKEPCTFVDPSEAATLGACIAGAYFLRDHSNNPLFQKNQIFFNNLSIFNDALNNNELEIDECYDHSSTENDGSGYCCLLV